jgi:hypothetical protein
MIFEIPFTLTDFVELYTVPSLVLPCLHKHKSAPESRRNLIFSLSPTSTDRVTVSNGKSAALVQPKTTAGVQKGCSPVPPYRLPHYFFVAMPTYLSCEGRNAEKKEAQSNSTGSSCESFFLEVYIA